MTIFEIGTRIISPLEGITGPALTLSLQAGEPPLPNPGRKRYEVPVGVHWFVRGLLHGSSGLGVPKNPGLFFIRLDASVWATHEGAIAPILPLPEISPRMGPARATIYHELAREFREPVYERVEAPATPKQTQVPAPARSTPDTASGPISHYTLSAGIEQRTTTML